MAQIPFIGRLGNGNDLKQITYRDKPSDKKIHFFGRLNSGLFINGEGIAASNGFRIIRSVSRVGGTPLSIDTADPLTISIWLYPQFTNASDNFIGIVGNMTDNGGATGLGYCLGFTWLTNTTFRVVFFLDTRNNGGNICSISSTDIFTFGRTYHFIVSKDASINNANWNAYLNGVLLSVTRSANSPVGSLLNNSYLKVGTAYDSELNAGASVYRFKGYVMRLKMLNRAITAAEAYKEYIKESACYLPNTQLDIDFRERFGKTIVDRANQYPFILLNYTDAETAANGSPQSGNTAWVNAYTLSPITN